jgi:stage II sporulation protein D
MKTILSLSVLLVIVALVLPFFTVRGGTAEPAPVSFSTAQPTAPEETKQPDLSATAPSSPSAAPLYFEKTDKTVQVRLLTKGEVITLSMFDYLVGVVAAEMPASFEPEALKAQAVAARTFTYYKMLYGSNHTNADVCDDCTCCKAYLSEEDLKERWSDQYEWNIEIIRAAVTKTDGLCVTYAHEPILAAFHSSSCGSTEDSVNVFHASLPYLVSVESPENALSVPNYHSELSVTFDEFQSAVRSAYPDAVLQGEPEGWIADPTYADSGRIVSVFVGGVLLSGTEFRNLFNLRSAAIEWSVSDSGFGFRVTGYGHGVGMSQYGANEFAKNGAGFIDILTYYYEGTQVENINAVQSKENQV